MSVCVFLFVLFCVYPSSQWVINLWQRGPDGLTAGTDITLPGVWLCLYMMFFVYCSLIHLCFGGGVVPFGWVFVPHGRYPAGLATLGKGANI